MTGGPIQALFDGIDNAFRPSPEARSAIVSIDIVGTAASATVFTNVTLVRATPTTFCAEESNVFAKRWPAQLARKSATHRNSTALDDG